MRKNLPIYGMVIEGQDCSGKSTICDLLKDRLLNMNIDIITGHGTLTQNNFVKFLSGCAYNALPDFNNCNKHKEQHSTLFNKFNKYSMSELILDLLIFEREEKENKCFFLQDRYFFSQILFNIIMNKNGCLSQEMHMFQSMYRPFLLNIYLTVSESERIDRMHKRSIGRKLDGTDLLFYNHPEIATEMDNIAKQLIKNKNQRENWMIIDTTISNPKRIANKILEQLKNLVELS